MKETLEKVYPGCLIAELPYLSLCQIFLFGVMANKLRSPGTTLHMLAHIGRDYIKLPRLGVAKRTSDVFRFSHVLGSLLPRGQVLVCRVHKCG